MLLIITLYLVFVPGGVNGDQFISSLEQFDKSGNSWNVPLRRDWRIINQVTLSNNVVILIKTFMNIMKIQNINPYNIIYYNIPDQINQNYN